MRTKLKIIHFKKNTKNKKNNFIFVISQRGSKGSWGEKANDVLKHTRGKSFRHEKTKKKRGNYKGGAIDSVAVHSVKFED